MSETGLSRVEKIKASLHSALQPDFLDIEDDSAAHAGHAGHAGARAGGGHFNVYIVSEKFAQQTLIQRHRLVYEAVDHLMGKDIHALSLVTKTPAEVKT